MRLQPFLRPGYGRVALGRMSKGRTTNMPCVRTGSWLVSERAPRINATQNHLEPRRTACGEQEAAIGLPPFLCQTHWAISSVGDCGAPGPEEPAAFYTLYRLVLRRGNSLCALVRLREDQRHGRHHDRQPLLIRGSRQSLALALLVLYFELVLVSFAIPTALRG
jgi:hypothetical protein